MQKSGTGSDHNVSLRLGLKSTVCFKFLPVLWIRILIGSAFRSFLDPDPYSEYGSGSTHANMGKNGGKRLKILINNSATQLIIKISLGDCSFS